MGATEATRPRRFLFVLWDGGGNVPPQLAVARRLVERGHAVRILAPRALEGRIEATGAEFVPYRQAPEHESAVPERDLIQDWAARTLLGAAARVRDNLMLAAAPGFAQDVLATLEEATSDAVVADYLLLGAYLGAERAGCPTVALVHHIYPFPAPGLPPFGQGFMPARGPQGRLRDAAFGRLFARFYDAGLPRLNAARAAIGLAPLASVFDLFARTARTLVLTSRAFDFPAATLPTNVRYVGPPFDGPVGAPTWVGTWAADDRRPLVVASFSTTFQRQASTVQRVIDALAALPVRALVTAGPALDPTTLHVPAQIVVAPYLPHRQIFPQADLVISHGGHGTVIAALAAGVPVLCLPMGRDQGDIAARVAWHGVGLRLASRARPAAIRRAVTRLLGESRFRDGARRLAQTLMEEDGAGCAVAELEVLVGAVQAAPVPR